MRRAITVVSTRAKNNWTSSKLEYRPDCNRSKMTFAHMANCDSIE